MELNKIYNEECIVGMSKIPDKSIDMILCDLPYGTTACKWDTIIPFEPLWMQYKRIIKADGIIALFGSQPFTSELVHSNIDWYSHSWVWNKNNSSNYPLAKIQPLKVTEDIIIFGKPNNYDLDNFVTLKQIFSQIMQQTGKSKKQIVCELGQGLDHCFRFDSLQWGLPTEKNYNNLIKLYNLSDIPKFEDLKKMYQDEFKGNRYNPQGIKPLNKIKRRGSTAKHFGDVSQLKTENMQEFTNYPKNILEFTKCKSDKGLHPTQKPVALLEYLIKTYTNENETVLDNCMGSGSTAIACINTNRNYIGFETNAEYFNISIKRIEELSETIRLLH
jgi:DNA modification methylase